MNCIVNSMKSRYFENERNFITHGNNIHTNYFCIIFPNYLNSKRLSIKSIIIEQLLKTKGWHGFIRSTICEKSVTKEVALTKEHKISWDLVGLKCFYIVGHREEMKYLSLLYFRQKQLWCWTGKRYIILEDCTMSYRNDKRKVNAIQVSLHNLKIKKKNK